MTPRSRRDGAGGVLLLLLLAGHMLAAAAADSGAAHAGGDADGAALDSSEWAVVTFPDVGTNIKDLPGADILHPKKHVTDIRLALAPALIEGPTAATATCCASTTPCSGMTTPGHFPLWWVGRCHAAQCVLRWPLGGKR